MLHVLYFGSAVRCLKQRLIGILSAAFAFADGKLVSTSKLASCVFLAVMDAARLPDSMACNSQEVSLQFSSVQFCFTSVDGHVQPLDEAFC